jgi:ribonucleoside-diphosphate reductase alpha chain
MSSVESLSRTAVTAASPSMAESHASLQLTPPYAPAAMSVTKRNGTTEPVDLNKIVRAVSRSCVGLPDVDAMRVATKTISGLYDGATTQRARSAVDPDRGVAHHRGAAVRQARGAPARDVHRQGGPQPGDPRVLQSIATGHRVGLVNARLATWTSCQRAQAQRRIDRARPRVRVLRPAHVYDRYLLRTPQRRLVIETPQQFFLRIACALSETWPRPSSCTGCSRRSSTCPARPRCSTRARATSSSRAASSSTRPGHLESDLPALHRRRPALEVLGRHRPRVPPRALARVADREHQRPLNGIVPWLKTLDASVAAVNQGGKRKGAAACTSSPGTLDIEEFLELRDNTGDEAAARTT